MDRRQALCVLILALLVLLPRLLNALTTVVVVTDALSNFHMAQSILAGDGRLVTLHNKPQAYPALIALFSNMTGSLEVAGYALSIMFALLTLIPVYRLSVEWLGAEAAVVSCLVFAFHPGLLDAQSEILSNSMYLCFFAWALYFLWRVHCEPRWSQGAWLASCLLGAFLTRTETVILAAGIFGTLIAELFIRRRDRARMIRLWAVAAIPAVLLTLSMVILSLWKGPGLWQAITHRADAAWLSAMAVFDPDVRAPSGVTLSTVLAKVVRSFSELGLFLLLIGIGIVLKKQGLMRGARFLIGWTLGYTLFAVTAALLMGWVSSRYFLAPALVAIPIIGLVLARFSSWLSVRLHPAAGVAFLMIFFLAAFAPTLRPRRANRLGWREAGEWIYENDGPGRRVLAERVQPGYYAHGVPITARYGLSTDLKRRIDYVVLRKAGDANPLGVSYPLQFVGRFDRDISLYRVLKPPP